jgi:hypothetical protein
MILTSVRWSVAHPLRDGSIDEYGSTALDVRCGNADGYQRRSWILTSRPVRRACHPAAHAQSYWAGSPLIRVLARLPGGRGPLPGWRLIPPATGTGPQRCMRGCPGSAGRRSPRDTTPALGATIQHHRLEGLTHLVTSGATGVHGPGLHL